MFTSVFTITYNQKERLKKTVEDLFAQDYPKDLYELIVVNDGSSDGTNELMEHLAKVSPVPLISLNFTHERNYQSSKLWNAAIAAASKENEVFIQVDDVELRPSFIGHHVKWHSVSDNYMVAGSKFEGPEETWNISSCRRAHLSNGNKSAIITQYTAMWGASLSYTSKMIGKISAPPFDIPYDERMVGWGFHEVEFAYRMQQAGAVLVYDTEAGVFHKDHEQVTELQRGINRVDTVRNDGTKNQQYVINKHNLEALMRW